ncbi:uncharacterized protein ACNS7B_005913 [Menidia menidia]
MADTHNGTCKDGTTGSTFDFRTVFSQPIVLVLCTMLALSLVYNILFCMSKCYRGKWTCRRRTKQSQSSRHMEDNPIYGNIRYQPTDVGVYSEAVPTRSSLISLSVRNPQRVHPESQSKTQDCYANLTLKAPRVQSGRSSPQIHSEGVYIGEPTEPEREDDEIADAASTMSDLYASVQTQRNKIIDTADDGEGYANHL